MDTEPPAAAARPAPNDAAAARDGARGGGDGARHAGATAGRDAAHRRAWAQAALMLTGHALLALSGGPRQAVGASLAGWTLAGAGWAWAVRDVLADRSAWRTRHVLLAALLLRVVAWSGEPSDDLARYVWEGRVQLAGHDPYRLPPDAPELAALAARAPEHAAINHPGWTAIYPPLTQLVQRALAAVAPGPWGYRVTLLFAEAVLLALLIAELRRRRLPAARVLIHACCPLAVFATAQELHHDVLAVTLLVASLTALVRGRAFLAGLLGAGAALAKVLPLATAPAAVAHARGRSRAALLAGAALGTAALCWPFRDTGRALLTSLTRFGDELHVNAPLAELTRELVGPRFDAWVLAALGLAWAVWVLRRPSDDPFERAALLVAGLLLLLPTLHPWYLVLLLPLLVLFPWRGWLALTLSSALTWLALLEWQRTGAWVEWRWIQLPEYAPLFAWLALRVRRRARTAVFAASSST